VEKIIQIVWSVIARFFSKAANFIVLLILIKYLPEEELGIYGLIFSSALILTAIWDVGLRNSIAYYVGKYKRQAHAIYSTALFIYPVLAFSSIASILAFLYYQNGFELNVTLIITCSLLVASMVFIRSFQGFFLGVGKLAQFNISEISSRLIFLFLILIFLIYNKININTVLISLSLSFLATVLIILYFFKSYRSYFKVKIKIMYLAVLFKRGFIFMLGAVVIISFYKTPIFIIQYYYDYKEVGKFFSLMRMAEIITELGLAISLVLFSHSTREKDVGHAIRGISKILRVSLFMIFMIFILFFIFSELFISIFLGVEFLENINLFRILLLSTFLGSIWIILQPTLTTLVSPVKGLVILLPCFGLNVILSFILTGKYGLLGPAYSLFICNIFISLGFLMYFKIKFGASILSMLFISKTDMLELAAKLKRTK
jgi:O-antigen/teichoic acid export membrane protein